MAKARPNVDVCLEHICTYNNEYQTCGRPKLSDILSGSPTTTSMITEDKMAIVAMYRYFGCKIYGTLKQKIKIHYNAHEELDQVTLTLGGSL
ncbi:hypothetical protein NVP2275O_245 [Vibrio phage 2.275.O._10N.286.54.E11]|nr:hypothetical protein NVP2275O_245 [Vibrio phage 2.275.O._10N.286.54.E11]